MTTALPLSITVTVNQLPVEVFMAFNRLNRLTYLVGSIDNLQTVMLNPEMRSAIIKDLVTPRDEKGKITKHYEDDEIDISMEDAISLLDFAQEHIMDFFMTAATKANRLVAKYQPQVSSLMPTPNGPAL